MAITVSPAQLETLLEYAIPAGNNVLVTGAPGIGKTHILKAATKKAKANLILSHPATEDPTDAKGLPYADIAKGVANFLPFGQLAQAIKAKQRTVWFLDDLGQATPAMQAAYMQLLWGGEVNGHKIPDHVTFVAATNRRTDKAGAQGILEPVKSRFRTIVELETSIDDWSRWAFANGVPPILVAFLRYRPQLLSDFKPTADLTNSPSPRTWSHVAEWEALKMPQDVELAAMSGAVGEGAAGEYLAFRKMASQLPNLDGVLMNPRKAPIPTEPSELYAMCMGLARKANVGNFDRVLTYAERLATEAQRGEFGVLLIRDVQRFDEDGAIQHTHAFTQMALGPIGALMDGRDIAA